VVYGDAALFAERPELMEAKVWVHFHSSSSKYNRIECWGPLKEATKVQLPRFQMFVMFDFLY
jgi:magnesium dechelatase